MTLSLIPKTFYMTLTSSPLFSPNAPRIQDPALTLALPRLLEQPEH